MSTTGSCACTQRSFRLGKHYKHEYLVNTARCAAAATTLRSSRQCLFHAPLETEIPPQKNPNN